MSRHNHRYQSAVSSEEPDSSSGTPSGPPRVRRQSSYESGHGESQTQPGAHSPTVLVGIPVYNEAGTIADVVSEVSAYASEVVVVDDGSNDGTRQAARAAGATLIAHTENQGYGAALKTIFQYARTVEAEHLVILDGDGQHDSSDIPEILTLQQETGAELVTGSRFRGHSSTEMPLYRQFGLAVINLLTNLGLRIGYSHPSISDTQCGFRAYDRNAIAVMAAAPDIGSGMGASIDILFQAAREGFEVVEIPTKINYDVEDANTQNPVVHGFELLVSLFLSVSRDRPFRMAGAIVLIALAVGGVALTLEQLGTAGASVLAIGFLALVVVVGVTLSGRFPSRSESVKR